MIRVLIITAYIFVSSCALQKHGLKDSGRHISSDYIVSEKIPNDSTLLSGYVFDVKSLSILPNATIRLGNSNSGVLADDNGYFELMVPEGFGQITLHVDNTGNTPLRIVCAHSEGGSVKRFIIYLGSSIVYDSAQ